MKIPDLKNRIDAYLALREALGMNAKSIRLQLMSFAEFLQVHESDEPIRAHLAVDWASSSSRKHGVSGIAARLSVARGFLRHLKASYPDTEIPDSNLIVAPRRPTPYLFSNTEIESILEAAGQLGPARSLRPYTHKTLFSLLACTGMRPGEAVRLLVADVFPYEKPARIEVKATKFKKSRWVPLHASCAEQLVHYLQLRRKMKYDGLSDYFFVSEQGNKLNYDILDRTFQRLLRRVGISARPGQRRPTLNSFRHTFAVQRLKQWYEEGADVASLAPNLSVYLGHVDPSTSYWYLTATPELLGAAAELFYEYSAKAGKDEEAK
jgi:integrase/recombinase XerD